jgi:hypothetical protein
MDNIKSIIKVESTKKCIINSLVQISLKYYQQFSSCHGCTDSLAVSWTNDLIGACRNAWAIISATDVLI